MDIGMLWFDNDPKVNLETKVERAVLYYRNKYGRPPTVCFVHPSMLPSHPENGEQKNNPYPVENGLLRAAGLEVHSNRSVLPNHFWIGIKSAPDPDTGGP